MRCRSHRQRSHRLANVDDAHGLATMNIVFVATTAKWGTCTIYYASKFHHYAVVATDVNPPLGSGGYQRLLCVSPY